jgi:hypothetical protein
MDVRVCAGVPRMRRLRAAATALPAAGAHTAALHTEPVIPAAAASDSGRAAGRTVTAAAWCAECRPARTQAHAASRHTRNASQRRWRHVL